MDPGRWQRVRSLAEQAWELPDGHESDAFLDRECDDPGLKREVEALLAADNDSEDFFSKLAERSGLARDDGSAPDLSGRTVGSYRLLDPLGRGGMGVVYLADRADGEFEQQVAVKLLAMGVSTPGARQRFLAERQILAGLEHPCIAQLFDGGVAEDGTPYFVMEHVEGERIDRWCDLQRLSVDERLRLMIQVCEAVEAAHRQLIVHRDLKPSNVLVTGDGRPKLLDFGVAKVLSDSESGVTDSQGAPLTPAWAAPEQISGAAVTTATDTHALGALLYLLLTGIPPHDVEDTSPTALAARLETEPVTPSRRFASFGIDEQTEIATDRDTTPGNLTRALRGDLDAVVSRALAPESERRYGSAGDLADDLRAHLASRPVSARPPSRAYRLSRFVSRHRLGVAAVAAILALLLSLVAVSVKAAVDSRRQAARVAAERDRARDESLRARQVTEFLKDLFRASDPDVAQGRQITARELLDQGAAQIGAESSFADNPDLRAEIQVLLGDLYHQIGDLEAAEELLAAGLESAGAGASLETRVEALHTLGALEMDLGEHEQALERLERAERLLELAERVPGRQHAALMELLLKTFTELGRVDEAVERGEVALTAARRVPDLESWSLFHYLNSFALVLLAAEEFDRAEPLLREAVALEFETADDPTRRLAVLSNLAGVVGEKGAVEEALDYRRQAVALANDVLDPLHPKRARTLNNLGTALLDLGRLDEAEAALREALEIYEQIYSGAAHPRVAAAHNNLGTALKTAERYADAEPHAAKAQELAAEFFGREDFRYAIATSNLGDLKRRLGRYHEAEDLLVEALEVRRSVSGADHPAVGRVLSRLAALRLDQSRPADALALTEEARALFSAGGYEHPGELLPLLERRARALDRLGRTDEARSTFAEALALGEAAGNDAGSAWPRLLGAYAEFLVDSDDPQARAAIDSAVEEHRRVLGDDHPATRRAEELTIDQ